MAVDLPKKFRLMRKGSGIFSFFQFFVLFLVIVSIILLTSSSFYQGMLENVTTFSLQNSVKALKELDLNSPDIINSIFDIENKDSVSIEIFCKENDNSYSKPIYRKTMTLLSDINGQNNTKSVPILDFDYSKFTDSNYEHNIRTFENGTIAGKYTSEKNACDFYVFCAKSDDGNTIFVVAKKYSIINAQTSAIRDSAVFILLIFSVLLAIFSYLFVTRITKPLRDIREVTSAMAKTNSTTLRIPTRNVQILNDTDETIASVNYLYERLILTQESLKEKTEFLAEQLSERDAEHDSREEFIASTSHELKTPIAIIQGYAEGAKFLSNDPDGLNEYCDTIIDECGRMTDLVVKMMTLSKLTRTMTIEYLDFSIRDFINERMYLHEKLFEKNGIKSENLIKEDIIGKADKDKMHFVVNNLLSNAVSYIGGDKIIRIRYEELDQVYRIFVFNSGKQIPQDDLKKLWESFYRNDPSRNRNEGHFGLGLSIVKSVQDAHSQACGVNNADGGVEFWFDIMKSE